MRRPREHLRTMMTAFAFLALVLTVVIQSVRLRQAIEREQRLRQTIEREQLRRAVAERERVRDEALYHQWQATQDEEYRKLQAIHDASSSDSRRPPSSSRNR
jgi:hypothetical protein